MARFTLQIGELIGKLDTAGVSVTGKCAIYCSETTLCPLCGLAVPPHTLHTCTRDDTKPRRRKSDR
jgi:hypothetical protein